MTLSVTDLLLAQIVWYMNIFVFSLVWGSGCLLRSSSNWRGEWVKILIFLYWLCNGNWTQTSYITEWWSFAQYFVKIMSKCSWLFFTKFEHFVHTLFHLFLTIFWWFSWFLRYFVNESLWNMQSLQSIWGVENLVFFNFWYIFTRKIMIFLTKIMTFYHDFLDNFPLVWVPS